MEEEEEVFVCGECGARLASREALCTHDADAHRSDRPFVCSRCGAAFKRKHQLERHVNDVHLGIRTYACTVPGCSAAYFTHTNLLKHMKMHERKLVCPHEGCGEVFHKKTQLRAHLVAAHTGEAGKPYACRVCARAFAFPSQLARHMLLHASVDHVCAYAGCGFVAHTAEALQQHVSVAHSEVAEAAAAAAAAPDDAATVVVAAVAPAATPTPTPEEAASAAAGTWVKCPTCGKLLRPQSLRKHTLTQHPAPDAPAPPTFVCTECGRTYSSKKSLRAHWNASHSDHRFVCTICGASFAYKVSLTRHTANVHAGGGESTATEHSDEDGFGFDDASIEEGNDEDEDNDSPSAEAPKAPSVGDGDGIVAAVPVAGPMSLTVAKLIGLSARELASRNSQLARGAPPSQQE